MVVAASKAHELFDGKSRPRIRDLLDYRWVLASPSVESRQWLDAVFDTHGLHRPSPKIETNLVLLMPRLIEQTDLLTFISRRHLAESAMGASLREVPIRATTMRRVLQVVHRRQAYLSPAARRLVALIRKGGKALFQET
jgi:DNA-binding transcriptional LysR family regulator